MSDERKNLQQGVPEASGRLAEQLVSTPPIQAWADLWTWMGRSVAVTQRLQQQSLTRMGQRWQEVAARQRRCLSTPLDCLDLPMASTRWALQEWDQLMQDGMAAALGLRGEVLMSALGRPSGWPEPDLAPLQDAWGQWLDAQMRLCACSMAFARHRPRGSSADGG